MHELNWKAIPELKRGGWRICSIDEIALVGTVEKNYLVFGPDPDPASDLNTGFIAKKAKRTGDLECVTEEMISRIGRLLPIEIADSRLARLPNATTVDIRFMSKNFVRRKQEQLVHGAELVANYLSTTVEEMFDVFSLADPKAERRFYTVDFVFELLVKIGRTAEERQHLLDAMGRMLAFDALIGAQDRHAMNWGIIESLSHADTPWRFAPLFDTARGLFGEMREEALVARDAAGGRSAYLERYARRSKPVFGCATTHDANHFDLVRHCIQEGPPEVVAAIREVIRAFSPKATEHLVRRDFLRVISSRRIEWIIELFRLRSDRLKLLAG